MNIINQPYIRIYETSEIHEPLKICEYLSLKTLGILESL